MRNIPHPHPLPQHALVRSNETGRTPASPKLDLVRHGTRCIPTATHDARRIGRRLRVVLSQTLLPSLHLATPTGRHASGSALPRDVLPVQTFQSPLAPADQTSTHRHSLASIGRVDAAKACEISEAA